MKLFVATQILLASYFKMKLVHASSLKDMVGSGCQNSVQLSSDFTTDSGEMCTTCAFCDGSNPNDIFKPKSSGVCIDCTAVEDTCANFRVTTTFDSAWLMEFVSLTPSSKPEEFDPKTVVIEGSTDTSAWVELYNKESNALFENRSEPTELLLNSNDTEYRYYRIAFKPHDNTSKFYVGHYDLIPSYTKTCTSNIYQAITGEYIRPFETPEPTQEPTLTPTPAPTTTAPTRESLNNDSLKAAVELWMTNKSAAIETYGHIEDWNTALVTDLASKFNYNHNKHWPKGFNEDISKWNVSSVTTLYHAFARCNSFNQNLSPWNVDRVRSWHYAFAHTHGLNQKFCWPRFTSANVGTMFWDSAGSIGC